MFQTNKLLFLFFSLSVFCANAQWQSQNTRKGLDFEYVTAYDNSHVWTIGVDVRVETPNNFYTNLYSLDSASGKWNNKQFVGTMNMEPTNFPGTAYGFSFISKTIGYVVGQAGLYKTTDAGNSWQIVAPKYIGSIYQTRKIQFVNNSKGFYLFGGHDGKKHINGVGTIKPMPNGDLTSLKVTISVSDFPVNFYFLDTLYGLTCSNGGRVFKTISGGDTWQQLNSGVTTQLNALYFVSKQIGFVVGADETILKTANGGIS